MTQRVELSGTQLITYTQDWDVSNRLVVITNTVSGQVTQYFYDADGQRVKRVTPQGTTWYVSADYEVTGSAPVQTVTVPATYTHKLYLPVIANSTPPVNLAPARVTYRFNGQQVAVREGVTLTFVHGDHLGSASLTTDISGTVVSEMRYYPFGEVRWQSGTMPTDRTFTGQRAENQSAVGSLMDYGARFYSPLLGRFISADSIVPRPGDPQAHNRYSYVRNSPLAYIDPSGHSTDCPAGDNNCWVNLWTWNNRWYEAHGHFWDGKGWNTPGDAKFADMGIAVQTLGEAGISILGKWKDKELTLVAQGVVALADKVGGLAKLQTLLGGDTFFVRYHLYVTFPRFIPAMVGLGQLSDVVNNTIEFFNNIFSSTDDYARGQTVHELAHVIDYHSSAFGFHGNQMWVGRFSIGIPDRMTNDITEYGKHGATGQAIAEYFAEAMADWVYGDKYFGPYSNKTLRNPLTTDQAEFLHDYLIR
ncbi:MAG: RHS repeat-associated core domain-containing protein [Chloroflexi bacterium]|nr:RHS repeat-associated core domain-containing protein [Chloroflexota bacterium]